MLARRPKGLLEAGRRAAPPPAAAPAVVAAPSAASSDPPEEQGADSAAARLAALLDDNDAGEDEPAAGGAASKHKNKHRAKDGKPAAKPSLAKVNPAGGGGTTSRLVRATAIKVGASHNLAF